MASFDYDVVIIGSGFGGSVAALRARRRAAIPSDFVAPYHLNDRKVRISVARVDDCLYAFDDLCTCADRPCPHSSRFDIATGAVVNGPATDALHVYEVQEVDNGIQVRARSR